MTSNTIHNIIMIYTQKTHPELYNIWWSMKHRCYNQRRLNRFPSYNGCSVHDDWIDNFQQFAEDYTSMVGYGLPKRHLDKDILVKGNKVYSNDTCVLVPTEINSLLIDSVSRRGLYPIGVCYEPSRNKYKATLKKFGKSVNIGRYDTAEEAYHNYKIEKENYIKEMAELYRSELDIRAHDSLMNWKIEK